MPPLTPHLNMNFPDEPEFPHVFLVGAEDGLLPHSRSLAEGALDEERRLFYVGITRARRSLTITHCHQRNRHGSKVPCSASRFLDEIEGDGVEVKEYGAFLAEEPGEDYALAQFSRLRSLMEEE